MLPGQPARHEEAQVELMTSGEFSRASRLTRKALRLYDELGLLQPIRVDPATGYRFYAPAQLEQARLVAWLRRLGMPLARIRLMTELPSAQAASELAAYCTRSSRRQRPGVNSRRSSSDTYPEGKPACKTGRSPFATPPAPRPA
jgi:DNA-binding transcriptional MerR regulator